MDDAELSATLKELAKTLPSFPDGRIDFTNANVIYGVSLVVQYQDQILFLKRNKDVHFYPNVWSVPSGFIDEPLPVKTIALKELAEETGITEADTEFIKVAPVRVFKDEAIGKQAHIFPVLIRLKQQSPVRINWEHTEYTWLTPAETGSYDRMPGVDENIKLALEQA